LLKGEILVSEKQKADFFRSYDLIQCRERVAKKPEATHQKEAITKLKKWFESNKYPSGAIIALPTGSGKTFTAVRFLCKNVIPKGYKVLWLAHTHHLLEQAFYSFGPLSEDSNDSYEVGWIPEPMETLNIRVVSGAPNQFNVNQIKPEDDVLIATLQSISNAYKNRHPKLLDFLKAADGKLFIVFDEAHHAPAPSYRNLIFNLRKKFSKMHIIGLTATPTATDMKKRGWFRVIFPQKIIHQTPIDKLMAEGILAKPIIKEAQTDITPEFDERQYLNWDDIKTDLPTRIVTQLAKNFERNKRIVENFVKNKDTYGKTIIFADRTYQCDRINTLLTSQGISSDVMYHQMGTQRNSEVLEKFRNNQLDVIVNIKMLTEGTDVPDLDTVFITRETTSTILMTQMVGRALRGPKFGGKLNANLVFFHDNWEKTINWAVWDPETWGAVKIVPPTKTRKPPIRNDDEIRRLLDMMDSGINRNPYPFLIFMPLGWFKVTVAEMNDEGNPEEIDRLVMVFENEFNNYLQLIEHLKDEDINGFDDEIVEFEEQKDKINIWCETFFPKSEKYVGDLPKNIFTLTKHMAQNRGESPLFIKFEDRKYHDLDKIARKFIEMDFGPTTVRKKLSAEYNREDRYWKVIYYNYEFFKFQYNACVEWVLDQDHVYEEPIRSKETRLIQDLNKGNSKERIRACELLGDMGLEETIHEETIQLIERIATNDDDLKVRKAAKCVVDLIGRLSLSPVEKIKIKERDNYRCLCCGETTKRYLEVDHIKPRYYEVDNSKDNLQTLCKICNITKSTDTIDFRRKETPLMEPPLEFPSMEKIDKLDQWSVRDLKWWDKFLKRNINFFYKCCAVKSIKFRGNVWKIILNDNNPSSWINTYLEELTEKIHLIRKEHGYSGPEKIVLFKKEPKECVNLIKILKSTSGHQQKKSATKLGNLGCKKAVNPLIKLLKGSDTFATPAAAIALGNIGDPRTIKPLIRMFKRENYNFRRSALRALVKIGKPAVDDLIYTLNNRNMHARQLSAEALGRIGDKKAVNNLIDSLNDEESSVRWMAARALGWIGDTKATKSLQEAQKDPDKKVVEESTKSLSILEKKIGILFKKLDDGIKQINNEIVRKKPKNGYSYFTPNKNFLRVYRDYYFIDLWLYIGNEKIDGVRKVQSKPLQGRMRLKDEIELSNTLKIIAKSYSLMKAFEEKK